MKTTIQFHAPMACRKKATWKSWAIAIFPWHFAAIPFTPYIMKAADAVVHFFGGCIGH